MHDQGNHDCTNKHNVCVGKSSMHHRTGLLESAPGDMGTGGPLAPGGASGGAGDLLLLGLHPALFWRCVNLSSAGPILPGWVLIHTTHASPLASVLSLLCMQRRQLQHTQLAAGLA